MQPKALTTEDWLDLALNELRQEGYTALKALPLSRKLNVTRGSFYHHFPSLDEFHKALIAHWSRNTSDAVIRAAQEADDPKAALDDLLQKTLRSGEQLERAVRSWATVQPLVAQEVEKVDNARIKVAENLLVKSGIAKAQATPRARLLYWAAIGRLMMPFPEHNLLSQSEITVLAALMLTG
ncbi:MULTISPECIES: TetR/AcrR family transcriptional regulator [unclassified Ruegeria]|uniref:TetR/AcrR family transcriptional regulator n=1 Tax=unclassified Ruegeria TaxID=2625375 RepID=UPI00148834C4|nr:MULTISPECIES: TetR/AcrR family transcriptional regulator [unclassified Ruegeria]